MNPDMATQVPVFYINMSSRPDRRQFMEEQFERLGIAAERFEAVTTSDIADSFYERYRRPWGYTLSRNEVACSLSHYAIWQTIVDRNLPAALIFEDDGVLSDRLPDFLKALGPALPDGVDVLKIETFQLPIRLSARPPLPLGGHYLRRLVGTHYGACGYVISRKVAAKALASDDRLEHVADNYLFSRDGPTIFRHRVYQLEPALSTQLLHYSDARQVSAASSNLQGSRGGDAHRKNLPWRLQRIRQLVRAAALELITFAGEYKAITGPRHTVPFAGAEPPTDKV